MRWALRRGASPFSCESCTEKDRLERNCSNFKGLSEAARAVSVYDEAVNGEIASRGCAKVASLGGLRLYECPLSYMSAETLDIMRVVFALEPGAGYFGRGLADEPCWLVEAVEVYRAEMGRMTGEKNGSKA